MRDLPDTAETAAAYGFAGVMLAQIAAIRVPDAVPRLPDGSTEGNFERQMSVDDGTSEGVDSMNTITVEPEFLHSSLANDPDLTEIVDLFVEELPDRVATISNCLAGGDWNGLRRYAHQLKGACGSYGFHQLTPAAAQVEDIASEECDEERIRLAVNELIGLCQKVRSVSAD